MEKVEQTIKNLAALLTESDKMADMYWKWFKEMQDKYIALENEYKALKAEKEKGMW